MLGLTHTKLQTLQPILTHLHIVVDEGIEWAKSIAKVRGRPIRLSEHGLSNFMRAYVCECLKQIDRSQMPYERVTLLNDGIEVQCLGHSIKVTKVPRILKFPNDFLPLGATSTRMSWWNQNGEGELFPLNEIIDIDKIRRVDVMWDVDEHSALNTFLLLLPRIGEPPIPIPHPATIEPMQEPMSEGTARDVPEVGEDDEPEDLDEISETGTEDL